MRWRPVRRRGRSGVARATSAGSACSGASASSTNAGTSADGGLDHRGLGRRRPALRRVPRPAGSWARRRALDRLSGRRRPGAGFFAAAAGFAVALVAAGFAAAFAAAGLVAARLGGGGRLRARRGLRGAGLRVAAALAAVVARGPQRCGRTSAPALAAFAAAVRAVTAFAAALGRRATLRRRGPGQPASPQRRPADRPAPSALPPVRGAFPWRCCGTCGETFPSTSPAGADVVRGQLRGSKRSPGAGPDPRRGGRSWWSEVMHLELP